MRVDDFQVKENIDAEMEQVIGNAYITQEFSIELQWRAHGFRLK